jgi:hypothetical protein
MFGEKRLDCEVIYQQLIIFMQSGPLVLIDMLQMMKVLIVCLNQ